MIVPDSLLYISNGIITSAFFVVRFYQHVFLKIIPLLMSILLKIKVSKKAAQMV